MYINSDINSYNREKAAVLNVTDWYVSNYIDGGITKENCYELVDNVNKCNLLYNDSSNCVDIFNTSACMEYWAEVIMAPETSINNNNGTQCWPIDMMDTMTHNKTTIQNKIKPFYNGYYYDDNYEGKVRCYMKRKMHYPLTSLIVNWVMFAIGCLIIINGMWIYYCWENINNNYIRIQ